MMSKHRFIRSESDLRRLERLEHVIELREDLPRRLEKLDKLLMEKVRQLLDECKELHDSDIQKMALGVNRSENLLPAFKASHSWCQKWKAKNGICSRKITTFVSKANFAAMDATEAAARQFVVGVRQKIGENVDLSTLVNADQSGFLKELHCARTLSMKGQKKVYGLVQSKNATTHSTTIMPLLFADGTLGEKLFIVLQETGGKFPRTITPFSAPNIAVYAGSSHIMTKKLLGDWVKSCVDIASNPTELHLVVDSWPAFKDHDFMKAAMSPGRHVDISNVPEGGTSMVQPCDVFFFRPFKE